jgi:predicted acyltransferase
MTSPAAPSVADSPTPPAGGRLLSLDALRGFDMFWILGADDSVYALHAASQGGVLAFFANQLEHADWAGFRFYDLIFPLFVFMVGVSIVFSLGKTIEREGVRGAHRRIFRRFILMFLLALIYSGGVSRSWPDIRLMGVLNRIALCYLFAALVFCHFRWKGMVAICVGLLAGYWALMSFEPFPDLRPRTPTGELVSPTLTATNTAQLNWAGTNVLRGVFDQGVNLANYIDQKYLPGKKWDHTWDPEGLLSTLPAIATCLLGVFAGRLLQNRAVGNPQKVCWLLGAGVVSLAAGWLWHFNFPVIKKIWTSSYVLVAGGYSAILLGVFYQVIEIWQRRKWCMPFVWIGCNAITLYLANNFLDFGRLARRLAGGDVRQFFDTVVAQGCGDVVLGMVALALAFALAHFLYRRKIFLRL